MEVVPDRHERRDVFCHDCGAKEQRSTFAGLLGPCSDCGSRKTHVYPLIGLPRRKRLTAVYA